ncbi:MAG: hypothetical protein K6F50_02065, partial [Kiritimatiellae bacterium]|nr:hypothetical protein [Kiritimatiellia bacterium]
MGKLNMTHLSSSLSSPYLTSFRFWAERREPEAAPGGSSREAEETEYERKNAFRVERIRIACIFFS